MHAFVLATGVGVVNETPFENRLQVTHQQVMDHPVAKVCGKDLPQLWFALDETDRGGGVVGAAD
jgi:hypothetical protein